MIDSKERIFIETRRQDKQKSDVVVIKTRVSKIPHGKMVCRVKVDEAGNRLIPEDTRITPIYTCRVSGRGGGEGRRSKKFGGSLFESCLQPSLRIRPLAAPLSGFSWLKELLLFCQRHYLIFSIHCPLIYLPFFAIPSSASSVEPDLN